MGGEGAAVSTRRKLVGAGDFERIGHPNDPSHSDPHTDFHAWLRERLKDIKLEFGDEWPEIARSKESDFEPHSSRWLVSHSYWFGSMSVELFEEHPGEISSSFYFAYLFGRWEAMRTLNARGEALLKRQFERETIDEARTSKSRDTKKALVEARYGKTARRIAASIPDWPDKATERANLIIENWSKFRDDKPPSWETLRKYAPKLGKT